jgi:transcriptional regulator with XRE-family HTH domain
MTDDTDAMVRRLAANLARLMRRRRTSAWALAERSGLALRRVEDIAAGAAEPDVGELFLLAGALEVDPSVLLEGIEWIPDGRGGGAYRIREGPD